MLGIILVRHGQTEWNAGSHLGEHFRGRIDLNLNTIGTAQARAVADHLAATEIAAVYSSPLKRAIATAEPIARSHSVENHSFEGLLDIDYGQWGGRSHEAVACDWPELYRRWRSVPHLVQIPGGECLEDVRRRVWTGLLQLLDRHDDETIVLVGHQAVNKVLICALLGLDNSAFWRIRQDTGCANRFEYDGGTFSVVTLNEVYHLARRPSASMPVPCCGSKVL